MANFSYRGRGPDGALVEGRLEGHNAEAVAGQLLGLGITPIRITEASESTEATGSNWLDSLGRRSVGLDDLIVFTRQLYSLVRAGVPITRGLRGLAETSRNHVLRDTLFGVVNNLESGHDLSSSLAQHPLVFKPILVSTVRVGENTGRLDEALLRVSNYLQVEKDTRERIKSALRYPSFVLLAIGIAIGIINVWVIPAFAGVFQRAQVELPWATQLLISTSGFFVTWWPLMLAVLALAGVGLKLWVGTDDGRYQWDRFRFRLPVVGEIIQQATLARFARGFSMSLRSGVPLIQGLTVVARAVDNQYLARHILAMRSGVERGDTLTRTAAGTGLFTPLVIQMMAVGEETGQINDLLDEVAGFYERDVDYAIQNLGSAIEPILLLAVGAMVLILALGVFLPMWDLSTTFR